MIGMQAKKLIIVTGEKETVYAELLSSLISLKDDDVDNNRIVGIKDGSVEAVVGSESVYNDNKVQLGSNTKIIFIGKNKASESIIPSISFDKSLKKSGIYVGSLSNKAAIYIDAKVLSNNKDLYDKFFESYKELTKEFDDTVANAETFKKAIITDGIAVAFGNGAKAIGDFFGGFLGKKNEADNNEEKPKGTDFFNFGAKIEANNLLPDQMFRYAVLSYYLNGLADFMEIK